MNKFFTILGLCIVVVLGEVTDEEKKAKFEADKNACIKEVGLDSAVAEKSLSGHLEEDDEKPGCFVACMAKKFGMMNPDGSINETKLKVRGSVSKERAAVVINTCKGLKGADDCETVMKVFACMYKEDGW